MYVNYISIKITLKSELEMGGNRFYQSRGSSREAWAELWGSGPWPRDADRSQVREHLEGLRARRGTLILEWQLPHSPVFMLLAGFSVTSHQRHRRLEALPKNDYGRNEAF